MLDSATLLDRLKNLETSVMVSNAVKEINLKKIIAYDGTPRSEWALVEAKRYQSMLDVSQLANHSEEDLIYFKSKLFAALGIPHEMLVKESGNGDKDVQ